MIKSNLAVLMAQRGLNITDLSKETGISRNTISSLYNNQAKGIQFDTLNNLCEFFDVDVNEIISKLYAKITFGEFRIDKINNLIQVETTVAIQNTIIEGTVELSHISSSTVFFYISSNIFKKLSLVPSGHKTDFLKREFVLPLINKFDLSPEHYAIKVLNPDSKEESDFQYLSLGNML